MEYLDTVGTSQSVVIRGVASIQGSRLPSSIASLCRIRGISLNVHT